MEGNGMIKKQYVKSRNVTKVTFELPSDVDAEAVELIADVNGWQPVPFEHLKNGRWRCVQELEPDSEVQFRYVVHNGDAPRYVNDPEADGTVPNPHGEENCFLKA